MLNKIVIHCCGSSDEKYFFSRLCKIFVSTNYEYDEYTLILIKIGLPGTKIFNPDPRHDNVLRRSFRIDVYLQIS